MLPVPFCRELICFRWAPPWSEYTKEEFESCGRCCVKSRPSLPSACSWSQMGWLNLPVEGEGKEGKNCSDPSVWVCICDWLKIWLGKKCWDRLGGEKDGAGRGVGGGLRTRGKERACDGGVELLKPLCSSPPGIRVALRLQNASVNESSFCCWRPVVS